MPTIATGETIAQSEYVVKRRATDISRKAPGKFATKFAKIHTFSWNNFGNSAIFLDFRELSAISRNWLFRQNWMKIPWKSKRKITDLMKSPQNFANFKSENLPTFWEIRNSAKIWRILEIHFTNLVDLEKSEKCVFGVLDAKIGVDTGEKEPRQVCWTTRLASRE